MWIQILVAVAVGLVAGRRIVAETTAHRSGLPDNWGCPECDVCGSRIGWSMRWCMQNHHRQPLSHILIPLATAAVFGAVSSVSPSVAVLPAYLVFAATMVTLTVTDLQTKLIPNRILGPATAIAFSLLIVGAIASGESAALRRAAIAAVCYFAALFVLALVSPGSLGFGDVKMALMIGAFTGYVSLDTAVSAGFGAFIGAGIYAAALIVTRRASRKDTIPFGPFMTIAALVSVVAGFAGSGLRVP